MFDQSELICTLNHSFGFQEKLMEMRKVYMALKGEVAQIDKRRKKHKRKREAAAAKATSAESKESSATTAAPPSATDRS